MKKLSGGMLALIIVLALVVLAVIMGVSNYNGMVSARESVESQMSNIDTQLQRRNDLIPNLVNTVKGYATHETEVFQAVSDARARLAGAGSINEKVEADNELSGALSRLLAITENYPDLKANQQFTALMDELSGTENRITIARQDYNETARAYNKKIATFPGVIFANMFGFEKYDYFEAAAGAENAPNVDFSK